MQHVKTTAGSTGKTKPVFPLHPIGAVAAMIARRAGKGRKPFVYIAETGRRRQDIFDLARLLSEQGAVAEFAAPDGLPGDGLPVSAATAGNRMATLRWLLDAEKRPSVVITTPAALIRKVPPRSIWTDRHLEICVGETLDADLVAARLRRLGYWQDDRVDEAGEFAIRGKVIEIFPAAAPRPCRIEHGDGVVIAIRSYDPASQRSVAETGRLIVDPASELTMSDEEASTEAGGRGEGESDGPLSRPHPFLCRHYETCETLFDYLPEAEVIVERGADLRAEEIFMALEGLDGETASGHAVLADHLSRDDWDDILADRLAALVDEVRVDRTVPVFALERQPYKAFADFAAARLDDGHRIVLAGSDARALTAARRRIARLLDRQILDAATWSDVTGAEPSSMLAFEAPIVEGFIVPESDVTVVSLRDLDGQTASQSARRQTGGFAAPADTFFTGDKVVHIDHGVAILDGLAPIETDKAGAGAGEALVLRFGKDETLLVPLNDIGAVWRYGGPSSEVSLDTLKGQSWAKRRNAVFEAISATAGKMVKRLQEKAAAKAAVIKPDRVAFERFCARFAYELTPDQSRATGEVLADLSSGHPMDRLVCGDVGYGKTEVALRAAAAAVFSGKQVAVVAPTTVLAQQHYREFVKRFAPQDVEVVRLSRLVEKDEAEATKEALASGRAKIVVGTHAIIGKDVAFKDLALVVIDEEQRFGSKHKGAMRALADGLHVLAMTATPIPRTLEAGFVGLSDLSIIAMPPVRRSPVRTRIGPFDDEKIASALSAEHARGGQSFVVCPRIEDLEPMADKLAELAPDQSVVMLHGRMKPEEVEDAMLAFANHAHDILLATTIVESGLDVANANTMIVCRADRFGLAELHQLRGRVGRGISRGHVLLTTEAGEAVSEEAQKRLHALMEFDTLGSGFDIAARDLDLRGTGDLLGDEQAGHLQTIGIALYRKTLERAIAVARGNPNPDEIRPVVSIGLNLSIPADYVTEPDMRIEIANLLERVEETATLDELRAEIADRFGPMPEGLETSFAIAALRLRCAGLGVTKLDLGPKAVALSFTPPTFSCLEASKVERGEDGLKWSKQRLVFAHLEGDPADPIAAAEGVLDRLESLLPATV
ncbi:DEAD/DEAH box helicase [Jiella mangrovi]|uniref:Transcription-repair-coupling factor n=1 Tax=Jiella mangrovi TaxID=2821407 RepID=A0ABS4BCE9_9HYPH|nr:DEAD/DEAH box helicase [Jiella mangrovi]MBP0614428.1 DEAD/DEAH box helicase [Jiella mangrovi]